MACRGFCQELRDRQWRARHDLLYRRLCVPGHLAPGGWAESRRVAEGNWSRSLRWTARGPFSRRKCHPHVPRGEGGRAFPERNHQSLADCLPGPMQTDQAGHDWADGSGPADLILPWMNLKPHPFPVRKRQVFPGHQRHVRVQQRCAPDPDLPRAEPVKFPPRPSLLWVAWLFRPAAHDALLPWPAHDALLPWLVHDEPLCRLVHDEPLCWLALEGLPAPPGGAERTSVITKAH